MILVPAGSLTLTGSGVAVLLPLPSSPSLLAPQASTWPAEARASVNSHPARSWVTLVPAGKCTLTGRPALTVLPLPSCPLMLLPQASTYRVPAAVAGPAATAAEPVPGPASTASPVPPARASPVSTGRPGRRRRAACPVAYSFLPVLSSLPLGVVAS